MKVLGAVLVVLYFLSSVFTALVLLYPSFFWFFLLCLVFLASILLAISGTVTAQIMLSLKHTPRPVTVLSSFSSFHKYILQTYNNRLHKVRKRLPVVFGRSVDTALQHLLDLVIRDLVSPWMEDLSLSSKDLQYSIKWVLLLCSRNGEVTHISFFTNLLMCCRKEIWYALGKLNKCLINVDETKLIAVDMVIKITSHFEKIRLVQSGYVSTFCITLPWPVEWF